MLISTSVLDNGVSLKNDNLHNVVIDSTDYVEFMQMLGRKRIKDNETINIYVRNKSSLDFNSYYNSMRVRIAAIKDFEENPRTFMEKQYDIYPFEIRKMFAFDRQYNMHVINKYLLYCLGQKKARYTKMMGALAQDKNAFAKEVCSWLDVDFKDEMIMPEDDIFEEAWKKIDMIIQSHSTPFDKAELDIVNDDIVKIVERIGRGYKFALKGSRLPGDINDNLKIMAKNGCPYYSIRKKDNKFFFEYKGEYVKASDDVSDEESDE